jgi:hypothetical protein
MAHESALRPQRRPELDGVESLRRLGVLDEMMVDAELRWRAAVPVLWTSRGINTRS